MSTVICLLQQHYLQSQLFWFEQYCIDSNWAYVSDIVSWSDLTILCQLASPTLPPKSIVLVSAMLYRQQLRLLSNIVICSDVSNILSTAIGLFHYWWSTVVAAVSAILI
jgi:hypothetical protein